ncbi:MAG TPA: OmpA family protein [Burkholderiaceae bacterium]|nr:OmpA family protein [Burkholderiaceae bacterium]
MLETRLLLLPAAAFTVAVLASGCAETPVVPSKPPAVNTFPANPPTVAVPARPPRQALATMETHQYLRMDPEKTGVLNAADDGRYTYLAFGAKVGEDTQFFDADGQPLIAARANVVVALPGIYKGILVRRGRANSYVAPNPRAQASDRPNLEADPDIVDARARLEIATTQLPAFRRAMQRADANQATGQPPAAQQAAAAPASAEPAAAAPREAPATIRAMPPPDDPTYTMTAAGPLLRVFFASGGRVIVRPDDGLQRLGAEAAGAREIRIAGFTDSIGPEAVNAVLAQSRAEAIKTLLIRLGVPAERIFVSWSGNARYLADNATERGRAMNRRVEVLFVKPQGALSAR